VRPVVGDAVEKELAGEAFPDQPAKHVRESHNDRVNGARFYFGFEDLEVHGSGFVCVSQSRVFLNFD
jgi:hypothetical protein